MHQVYATTLTYKGIPKLLYWEAKLNKKEGKMICFVGKMKGLTYLELWLIFKFGRLLEPLKQGNFNRN